MGRTYAALLAVALVLGAVAPLEARQSWQLADQEWCEDSGGSSSGERLCEVRTTTLVATGSVDVDAGPNGGVRVEAWDRDEVEVVARVQTRARSAERAREILEAVELEADGGRVGADGPRTGRRESWTVSYRLRVPSSTDLRLLTTNGGLSVELADSRWDGGGLDVQTTNGGVRVTVPEQYSAELELSTRNGSLDLDFPVTVQGRLGRSLRTTLGDGGPTIRVATTNGSVHVSRP